MDPVRNAEYQKAIISVPLRASKHPEVFFRSRFVAMFLHLDSQQMSLSTSAAFNCSTVLDVDD